MAARRERYSQLQGSKGVLSQTQVTVIEKGGAFNPPCENGAREPRVAHDIPSKTQSDPVPKYRGEAGLVLWFFVSKAVMMMV